MSLIYLDNAATSWPKPDETIRGMVNYMQNAGGSPGRSGHRLSIDAARIIYSCRELLSELFFIEDPLRIIFTKNATEALNISINGLLKPGDHVITSCMEHNSVMRPLRLIEKSGVEVSCVECSHRGELDPGDIIKNIRSNTVALILTHASNVTGGIMPVEEAGNIAKEHGLIFCVDAAQTAGAVDIDVVKMNIDLLAFAGHKSLMGPQGTGGLYIDESLDGKLTPLMTGGTGSMSEHESQPDFLPDMFESGTLNTVGIAGLEAGIKFILKRKVETIRKHEIELIERFIDGTAGMERVQIYGLLKPDNVVPVFSLNIEGMSSSEVSLILDEEYGIMSRPGLQCSPSAHRTIGTFSEGTVRISFGFFNTVNDVDSVIQAIREITRVN